MNAAKADEEFQLVQSAFKKSLMIYSRHLRLKSVDTTCLWQIFPSIKQLCEKILAEEFSSYQLNLSFFGIFEKLAPVANDEEPETEIFCLKSNHFAIKPGVRFQRILTSIIRDLDDRLENLLLRGSGWALNGK